MDVLFRELSKHIEAYYYLPHKSLSKRSENKPAHYLNHFQPSTCFNQNSYNNVATQSWQDVNPNGVRYTSSLSKSQLVSERVLRGTTMHNLQFAPRYTETYNPSKYWSNDAIQHVSST